MTYIFSFLAGRHKSIMWTALSLRWLFLLMVAHWPFTIVLISTTRLGAPLKWVIVFAVLVALSLFWWVHKHREFTRIVAFRRRWPHTWATCQKKQITDMDDGHYNRPWLTAPRLSWFYKRSHKSITFKVRPAVGSNLQVLQSQASDLAAQYKNIDSLEVSFIKPSDYRGELKVLLHDSLAKTKHAPTYERQIPYASTT